MKRLVERKADGTHVYTHCTKEGIDEAIKHLANGYYHHKSLFRSLLDNGSTIVSKDSGFHYRFEERD